MSVTLGSALSVSRCPKLSGRVSASPQRRSSKAAASLPPGKKVIDVAAGSTHCLALTEDSEVHSWGNNDQCQHFDTLHQTKPEPSPLPGLDTKHIVGIACGPAQVRAWLRVVVVPSPIIYGECTDPSLSGQIIFGSRLSPPQSFAWSSCSEWSVGLRVPFVVDVCSGTFEQLDLLLRQVSEGMDGTSDWPPPQEKECMAVATLNLLRLQVGTRPSREAV